MKRMLINATQKEELRVALVDGQRLYDLDIETISSNQKKANIYKGKITRVEPSLEAAFVDYGTEKHGFLPIKEISKTYFPSGAGTSNGKQNYKALEGQEVMVQIDKEARGTKGAALTTFVSLAGRYLVLMPNNPNGGGVSRRIQGSERKDLKDTLDDVEIPNEMGTIIRTAGVGRSKDELQWDLDYQVKIWQAIESAYSQSQIGDLLYQESNIILRALRDYFREDIAQIIIDDETTYQNAHGFMSLVIPDKLNRLKLYKDELPLFTRYQIESQIDSAYGRNVKLPSGGELVVDYTEAMVSIDINSARSTKGVDVEETAYNTNLEAASEIARQLRLRDIGGLIVIDFIDMYDAKHRKMVEEKINEEIKTDRARVQTARISKFGLLEMSRQRLRPSIDEASHTVCPRCKGQGSIRSTQSVALSVLRLIEEDAMKENTAKVVTQLPVSVATFLLNEKRNAIANIEKNNKVSIVIVANPTLQTPHFDVMRMRDDDETIDETALSYNMTKDFSEDESEDKTNNIKPADIKIPKVTNIMPESAIPKTLKPSIGIFTKIYNFFFASAEPEKNKKNNRTNQNRNSKNTSPRKPLNRRNATNPNSEKPTNERDVNRNTRPPRDNKTDKPIDKSNINTTADAIAPKKAREPRVNTERVERTSEPRANALKPNLETNAEIKPFVNDYAKDKSKMSNGRPVSQTAQQGAGKPNAALTKSTNINENNVDTANLDITQDVSLDINSNIAADITNNAATVAPAKPKRPARKPRTPVSSQVDNDNLESSDERKSNVLLPNDRVWMPHAVADANPALFMSDNLQLPERKVESNVDSTVAIAKTETSIYPELSENTAVNSTANLTVDTNPATKIYALENNLANNIAPAKSELATNADAKPENPPARQPDIKNNNSELVLTDSDNRVAKVGQFGQSIWYDNISRDLLESGELNNMIANDDLRGITSNPAIYEKAIASNHPSYLNYLAEFKTETTTAKQAFFTLAIRDITEACDAFAATYHKTDKTDGMASLEVSPDLAYNAEKTIEEGLALWTRLAKPNAMIKVPATHQGLVAIEQLIYMGVNVNATLLFSVERYVDVFKAYMNGLKKRLEVGMPIQDIRSVASFFISRIDTNADLVLSKTKPEYRGLVAIANAKMAYAEYQKLLNSELWQQLAQAGAKPQRLLWASTGTKNPNYSATLYIDELIGPNTVNTVPPATYEMFKTQGKIANRLLIDVGQAKNIIDKLPELGVDLDLITQKLEKEGIRSFEQSFVTLLDTIAQKM